MKKERRCLIKYRPHKIEGNTLREPGEFFNIFRGKDVKEGLIEHRAWALKLLAIIQRREAKTQRRREELQGREKNF
jgi:hypothetical protein